MPGLEGVVGICGSEGPLPRTAGRIRAARVESAKRHPGGALGVAAIVLSLLATPAAAQLSQIYLHDDKVQKITEGVQTGFKAAAPGPLFDDQQKFFAALARDEQSWVRNSVIARRDLALITLITGTPQTRDALILDQLEKVAGPGVAGKLESLNALDVKLQTQRDNNLLDAASLTATRKSYVAAGGDSKASTCADVKPAGAPWPGPVDLTAKLSDKELWLWQLRYECGVAEKRGIDKLLSVLPQSGDSQIAQTLIKLKEVDDAIVKQHEEAEKLNRALKEAREAIDKDPKSSTAELAGDLLTLCLADPKASASQDAGADAKEKTKGKTDPSLKQAIDTCLKSPPQASNVVAKLVQHEFLAEQIQKVLDHVLASDSASASGKPADQPPPSPSTAKAIRTIDLLAGAADQLSANSRPSVNALLIALAYEQHQVAKNRQLEQTLKQRKLIYEEQREALISEASHLARALTASRTASGPIRDALANENAARVLTEVNAAWSAGRYRAELANYADIALERDAALANSREVVAGWSKLLQPAIDELAAYGKGGVQAQTVASFLNAVINAFGFSAVAAAIR